MIGVTVRTCFVTDTQHARSKVQGLSHCQLRDVVVHLDNNTQPCSVDGVPQHTQLHSCLVGRIGAQQQCFVAMKWPYPGLW